MEPGEGVVLTVVSGEPEAEVVCGLLRSAGIDCVYRDTEAIDSPLEDFTAAGPREILVQESDLDAARELLAASAG
jgi:putative signal transducing protein